MEPESQQQQLTEEENSGSFADRVNIFSALEKVDSMVGNNPQIEKMKMQATESPPYNNRNQYFEIKKEQFEFEMRRETFGNNRN